MPQLLIRMQPCLDLVQLQASQERQLQEFRNCATFTPIARSSQHVTTGCSFGSSTLPQAPPGLSTTKLSFQRTSNVTLHRACFTTAQNFKQPSTSSSFRLLRPPSLCTTSALCSQNLPSNHLFLTNT
ncbi:hypothetical protein KC19_VG111900 [Ceratodon purpureus]|uniref:Uncharacterized protein n=1 Tax=Ceratodon purpureus TaxID=3225 RepID=A0A8T0HPB5_CERPU|nr:hypothetical protein KC19_VG111900 [Ceratodon purpureus]